MMKDQKHKKHNNMQQVLDSYCQVCFVPFNRVVPKKLDEGEEILFCVKCKCHVHKCCYDMEANSSFVTTKLRQFVCQRCDKAELTDKACIICHKKQGALKQIGANQVIHVFCGLMHNDILTTGYFPQITFKKSDNYKQVRNACGLCSKPNANEQCAMESCFKRYHGYCIWLNLKAKQLEEDDPQCEKYYLTSGDNGVFDLTSELMQKSWVYQQFDKVLTNFQEYGFKVEHKQDIKNEVYQIYEKEEKQQKKSQNLLKRGGFAYALCKDHESSVYCNCLNRGSGDMVQCQCCFEWYHQKCVSYQPSKASQNYICTYCQGFYDLKKKIIDEVKSPKTEGYELKFENPKLHLNDFTWLLRVIDHRIAGGAATKMIKQLAKYPLKTSKMELVIRNQNKKKLFNLTQLFIQKYLQSKEHQSILKARPVLGLDKDQKPIVLTQNVEYNKKLKNYVDFIQNFVRKNNLPDSFGPIIHELKFKERAIEDNYDTILELSKSQSGYPEIAILKIKVEEFSFMEVIKDIDSGSMIRFEDLEGAVLKTKNSSSSIPSYLLKPLIQRYEKVKNLVQLVSNNIHQKKESSPQTQSAVRKLKQQKILPPQVYLNFQAEKKFINELYLLYLKQQGKPLEQSVETGDKIQILLREPACKPNREVAECVNEFNLDKESVFKHISDIVSKYSKISLVYQLKQSLKKKSIRLSALETIYKKYTTLNVQENDPQVTQLISLWGKLRHQWIAVKNEIQNSISSLDSIETLSRLLKDTESALKGIETLPLQILSKSEEVQGLGSIHHLEQLKSWVETLAILFTEAQLKKNPMTVARLPEGLSRENPLVKQYYSLKRQQNELMNRYNSIYSRANQKIEALRSDQKKPRNQQMKENLQKPRMNDVNHFLEQLKSSNVNMETQIKQLTKSVNKSIEIGSRVSKFIAEQKHLQSMFKEDQVDAVKKQIDELRKRVLLEAEISLENELKQLYHAEICVRMQKMIITSNAELDKMSKLLKFAEEEGLNHISTYRRLKSKFQVGNQSNKQITLTKKHEQYLASEAQKLRETDTYYSSLVFARKNIPLSIPQQLKQKNRHYEELLAKNQYLKTKIDMVLSEEPKKFEVQQAKVIYLQALKHPFQVEGLNKLINEFDKLQKVQTLWKQQRQFDSSKAEVFQKYQDLIFVIDQIASAKKSIQQCEQITSSIRKMKQNDLNLQSLFKVEESLEIIEQNNSVKNNKIYNRFKMEYYSFWLKLLEKFREDKNQCVPFSKIKSILLDVYTTIQRNIRINSSNEQLKQIVQYLQDLMVGIRSQFENKGQNIDPIYQGFVDLQELKYEVSSGLDIKDEIKVLNPFNDISRFYHVDLQRTQSRNFDESNPLRRQRTETELQDPYLKQSKYERSHKNITKNNQNSDEEHEQWEKNTGTSVSEAQRVKAKQLILKNIKKNPELANYENLPQQVKMIENQLFGDNHNQVLKYFELVNSFEKLFIKLKGYPNISAKVAKKKFEWKFLMLLIQNIQQFNDIQNMIVDKNKQAVAEQKQQAEKKEQKAIQKQKEAKKQSELKKQKQKQKQRQKTVQEMLVTGRIDETTRQQLKRQIRSIKEKNKKKKHKSSSRRRSRSRSSRSISPQAKFSSQSQQPALPQSTKNESIDYLDKPQYTDPYSLKQQPVAPLLYDPEQQQMQETVVKKQSFPRGTALEIKSVNMEMAIKKRGKTKLKASMITNEDHQKVISQLVDPKFQVIELKKNKPDAQIIIYLNKPSRKKYKFLVGWFEAEGLENNTRIREFANECSQEGKIYGVQNQNIKMHVMSIFQYARIHQMHDPPGIVTSQPAQQALSSNRLVFVIQYPSDRMYQLKGIYPKFEVTAKQNVFNVEVPNIQYNMNPMGANMFMPNYMMGYNPMIMPQQQIKPIEINPLKPVQYEGWGNSETAVSSYSNSGMQSRSFNPLNQLSRFSPIMTDEQGDDKDTENNKQHINKKESQPEIDLASNILNSLADVNLKPAQITRSYPIENRPAQDPYRYPAMRPSIPPQPIMASNPHIPPWQPQPMHSGQMGMSRMPYNPMAMPPKYQPQPMRQAPPAMYKNPMMASNPYGYSQPPPAMQGQGQQQKPAPPYDPYMYQRQ